MIQVIPSRDIGIAYLEEKFCLQLVNEEQVFAEWLLEQHIEPTKQEKCYLDRVKSKYLNLVKQRPISEDLVKMVVLSPLLDLAGFYRPPFYVETEESIEITQEDEGEILKGRIDVLVLKQQFWLLVIESKITIFSLYTAIPQGLAYMLSNPYLTNPVIWIRYER